MPGSGRIHHPGLARKVMPADAAAAMIDPGATVGMSGFTGAGYPKEVPLAPAQRIVVRPRGLYCRRQGRLWQALL
jgi:succinyl-CoA:acetate CoA-transferase